MDEKEQNELDVTKLPEITRDEFRAAVKQKGFAINKKNADKIFTELDYDRNNTVCYKNFRQALLINSGESTPDYILNKISLELRSREITVEQLFKLEDEEMEELGDDAPKKDTKSRRRKNDDDGMNFQEFTEAISKLNLELDIVDLETLFLVVDKDNSGLLSKEEI
jgi:Ca2+-binding EF-hand superfamily protein